MTEITTYLDFAGRRADGKLIKGIVPQFDGSRYASGNCAAASEAMRDRIEIAGRGVPGKPWPPTGASIRAGTGDTVGGVMPTQTAGVSHRLYGIDSDIRIADWSVIVDKLRNRIAVTLLVHYGPIAAAGKSGSPGFTGEHSVELTGIRGSGPDIEVLSSDPLYDGRRDGIPEGPEWISIGVMKRAASDLIIDGGLSLIERYGPNKGFCSFGIHEYTPPAAELVLRFGGHKLRRPRHYRLRFNNTNLRSSPRKGDANIVRVVDIRKADGSLYLFAAYQYVVNAAGKWIGNKDGTRWLLFGGVAFHDYI